MTALDDLVKRALVGTQRAGDGLPSSLPDELRPLLESPRPADALLLDAAAAATLYARCGVTAAKQTVELAPARDDLLPVCSVRAGDVLQELCDRKEYDLLAEWFAAAARAGKRLPHKLLPDVLERAAERVALRDAVEKVIDRRGHWLAGQNPRWQFARPAPTDLEAAWETGSSADRLNALKAVRETDPAKAAAWVQATWAADPADDRVKWLGVFAQNLTADDEAFLEPCLDDRSSRVREVAAALLTRLPGSAYVKRMIARLERLLAWNGQQLSLALPEAFDKAMFHDGLTEKPPPQTGPKQWWRSQMLAAVPPAHWSARFNVAPETLIAGVERDDQRLTIEAWRKAAGVHRDPAWAVALALSPIDFPSRWGVGYLSAVPAADRPAVIASLWQPTDKDPHRLGALFEAWAPLTAALSEQFLAFVNPEGLLYAAAAAHLHPAVLDRLEPILDGLTQQQYIGGAAKRAVETIQFRRTIHTEFAA